MPQDAFLGVHPSQVALINKALKPGPVGLHWAQSIIETARSGEGGVLNGQVVDAPVVGRAQSITARSP
ncbi:Citrate lyase subunit beta-like protein [compost metagenome]